MDSFRISRFVLISTVTGCLVVTGCTTPENDVFQGYVEGDYLYLAAPGAGYLERLYVDRGSKAKAGTLAFSLNDDPDRYRLNEAAAQITSAQEKITNLQEPHRQPEISAMEAALASAEANLRYSESQLKRLESLIEKGFVPKSDLDQARSARDRDAAQVEAARKQLTVYRIALGRKPEIRGAEADLEVSISNMKQKRWLIDKMTVSTPSKGEIIETYYRPGEWVPAGQPVSRFLPDDRRRIRFFVPETDLAKFYPDQGVEASCDGCNTPVRAKIAFVSVEAEYTPPVIYSRESRSKLVFRVEAVPDPDDAARLHPGLPMDVRLLPGR